MNKTDPPQSASAAKTLLDLQDGETGFIRVNGDRKSTEMGLFPGVQVVMFRNRRAERSLVIGAGDARFLISRAIAGKVEIDSRDETR